MKIDPTMGEVLTQLKNDPDSNPHVVAYELCKLLMERYTLQKIVDEVTKRYDPRPCLSSEGKRIKKIRGTPIKTFQILKPIIKLRTTKNSIAADYNVCHKLRNFRHSCIF